MGKYSNLEYKEAFFSQKYFGGKSWTQMNKQEKASFSALMHSSTHAYGMSILPKKNKAVGRPSLAHLPKHKRF